MKVKIKGKKRFRVLAFTLIELVAVVTILGILLAIVVPKFTKSYLKGQAKGQEIALKTLKIAQETYASMQPDRSMFPKSGGPVTDLDAINRNLSIALQDNPKWSYALYSKTTKGANMTVTNKKYDAVLWIDDENTNVTCVGADCGRFGY